VHAWDGPEAIEQFETADMAGGLDFPGRGQIPVTVGRSVVNDDIGIVGDRLPLRSPCGTACSMEACIPWVSLIATMERLRVGMAVT
jgi:hypothetical protein